MVECESETRVFEVAFQTEIACVPIDRVGRNGIVAIALDKLLNTIVFECYRSTHVEVLVETKCANEPFVAVDILALEYKVLSDFCSWCSVHRFSPRSCL